MGLEPTAFSLATRRSTIELLLLDGQRGDYPQVLARTLSVDQTLYAYEGDRTLLSGSTIRPVHQIRTQAFPTLGSRQPLIQRLLGNGCIYRHTTAAMSYAHYS